MKERQEYTAREKCRAVLTLWSEKRKGVELSRAMGVSGTLLNQWQERAMDGLLSALEPKWPEADSGPALNGKLRKLLDRKVVERQGRLPKLERRLARLQGRSEAPEEKPEPDPKG